MKNLFLILLVIPTMFFSQDIVSKKQLNKENIKDEDYRMKTFENFIKKIKIPIENVTFIKENEEHANQIIIRFDSLKDYKYNRKKNKFLGNIIVNFYPDYDTKTFFYGLLRNKLIIENKIEINKYFIKIKNLKIYSIEATDDFYHN